MKKQQFIGSGGGYASNQHSTGSLTPSIKTAYTLNWSRNINVYRRLDEALCMYAKKIKLMKKQQFIGSGGGYGSNQHSTGSYLGYAANCRVKREDEEEDINGEIKINEDWQHYLLENISS